MYKYDTYDQAMVDARVEEFRDQVKRRIEGTMTEDQFKPLRLMNGLYLQLHAYMLRVAVPYGTLNRRADADAGDIARTSMTAAMATSPPGRTSSTTGSSWRTRPTSSPISPAVEMHAIQTSGNCIRNISADQYAGARPTKSRSAPLGRTAAPVVDLPPRIQLSAAQVQDRVIASDRRPRGDALHDIGMELVKQRTGELGARVFVGGGMGRTPMIAPEINATSCREDSSSELCRGLPARLQPLWPPRQQVQGADQDPGPRTGRGRISPQVESRIRPHVKTLGLDPPRGRTGADQAAISPPGLR
jgi:sulfite reductase (NADPH) hemoprotein beta-component